MQTWKLQLPVPRSWSFGFWFPSWSLGTRRTLTVFAFLRGECFSLLMAFCHYNTEKHEFKTELKDAIDAVTRLKKELTELT